MTENKTLEPFVFKEKKDVFQCSVLKVQEKIALSHDKQHELKVYTFSCANWVNIVPVTANGEVVLIEQHRFGSDSFIVEVPGGAVDSGENDVTLAAKRELEEETGLTSERILALSGFYPNPAIQSNRVSNFIAFDVFPCPIPPVHKDPFEEIQFRIVSIHQALYMARSGQIAHALSALALLVAEPYLLRKFPPKENNNT